MFGRSSKGDGGVFSTTVAYSTLRGSAGSVVGCSTVSSAMDVAFGMGVEEEGYSELAKELTNRSRTSECIPCSSSNSSRSITGVFVGGAGIAI